MLPGNWTLAIGAAMVATGLATGAAALLAKLAEERDLAARLRSATRTGDALPETVRTPWRLGLLRPLIRLGETLRDSTFVSEKELAEFQRAVAAAGLDARQAVPVLLGAKVLLVVTLPLLGFLSSWPLELEGTETGLAVFGGVVAAVFAPNLVVRWLRRPFTERLRRGLPDALDLLVVAAEAGLALESGLERVAREMEGSNRAIALELNVLVQEMRIATDRRVALERFGQRTGLEGFRRLGATLSQTLRYGTPLAQALRVLAAEMRDERMLKLEEKAVRLPSLLIMPLILFILPALFIALVGPSVLHMSRSFGG
ncbi:type II secretion system F family protein [Roseomonas sp. CCTCC AB2023176]|uniref:type II secretion system F family protein n=1 Tax=Roseomonas sp. CCTCC AB2023176 TaxID=3342640 RepID=UPI0035D61D01